MHTAAEGDAAVQRTRAHTQKRYNETTDRKPKKKKKNIYRSRGARNDVGYGISSSCTGTSLPWDIRNVNRNVLNRTSRSLRKKQTNTIVVRD